MLDREMKYIRYINNDDNDVFVVFSDRISHKDFSRSIDKSDMVSAGFCKVVNGIDGLKFICSGSSTSLNLKSLEEDSDKMSFDLLGN